MKGDSKKERIMLSRSKRSIILIIVMITTLFLTLCLQPVKTSMEKPHAIDLDNNLQTIDKDSYHIRSEQTKSFNPFMMNAVDVFVSNDLAFVEDGFGLAILNISNPASPTFLGNYREAGPGAGSGVYYANNYAYIVDQEDGLMIIDTSNVKNPIKVAQIGADGCYTDVHVVNDLAYVAGYDYGLEIINVSNPYSPYRKSLIYRGQAWGVLVKNDYVYLAAMDNGLQIINISNPSYPSIIGLFNDGEGFARNAFINGGIAYLANDEDGLKIINITNPANPNLIGALNIGGEAMDVIFSRDHAYIVKYSNGIVILDVSNLTSPIKIKELSFDADGVEKLFLTDELLYVAGGMGLIILDISDPRNPTKIGEFPPVATPPLGRGMFLSILPVIAILPIIFRPNRRNSKE